MTNNIHELDPRKGANLVGMEDDLRAVKSLAFAISLMTVAEQDSIQTNAANALWEIARAIGDHADALIARWKAVLPRDKVD